MILANVDLEAGDLQRNSLNTVRLDDGESVVVDGDDVGTVCRDVDDTEPVPLALLDGDDRERHFRASDKSLKKVSRP
jgi:hypothetical protein